MGWRLVPDDPTQEMVRAAYQAQPDAINVGFAQAYRDMLAEAPAAPVKKELPTQDDVYNQAIDAAMATIESLRHQAASDFKSPNCQGQRGVDRTDTLYDAHEALRALKKAVPSISRSSAGSEPVAWMCEKAIWEIVETQRIGGRWLRYLTFDRPAEAEYTRNITPLYSVSPQGVPDASEAHRLAQLIVDYTDNNLSMFDACDMPSGKAQELHEQAKALRDRLALSLTRPQSETGK